MCPFCISSAALLATSVFSAGGVVTVVVNKLHSKSNMKGAFMKLADTILMELDQEAQTTKRVWIAFLRTSSPGGLTRKPFRLVSWPCILRPCPGASRQQRTDSFEAPGFNQPTQRSPGSLGHLFQEP